VKSILNDFSKGEKEGRMSLELDLFGVKVEVLAGV